MATKQKPEKQDSRIAMFGIGTHYYRGVGWDRNTDTVIMPDKATNMLELTEGQYYYTVTRMVDMSDSRDRPTGAYRWSAFMMIRGEDGCLVPRNHVSRQEIQRVKLQLRTKYPEVYSWLRDLPA